MDTFHRTNARPGLWIGLALCAVLALSLATLRPSAPAEMASTVDAETLRIALSSTPDTGLEHDEIAFFEERLERNPSDALALRRLAGAHLRRFRATGDQADLDAVHHLVGLMQARDADDPALHATRASWGLASHRFQLAVNAARAARECGDPGDEDGVLRLFDALWASGAYAEAEELLSSTRFERESMGLLSREARLVDGFGDTEGGRDRMARVVELADAYAEPPVIRAWARVEHGHFTLHAGDPEAAVDLYLQALGILPGYPAALEALGWVAWGVDESPQVAEALFERALENGGHLDIMPVLAEIAEARGAHGEAERLRATFVDTATSSAEAEQLYLRPLAQELVGDPATRERALALAERDLAHRSDRGAWATRALVLSRMGRHDEAAADARRAIAWGAPTPDVLHLAGTVLHEAGEHREGEKLLREALEGRIELGPRVAGEIEARLGMRGR